MRGAARLQLQAGIRPERTQGVRGRVRGRLRARRVQRAGRVHLQRKVINGRVIPLSSPLRSLPTAQRILSSTTFRAIIEP